MTDSRGPWQQKNKKKKEEKNKNYGLAVYEC
jgi:hypothetical protein